MRDTVDANGKTKVVVAEVPAQSLQWLTAPADARRKYVLDVGTVYAFAPCGSTRRARRRVVR